MNKNKTLRATALTACMVVAGQAWATNGMLMEGYGPSGRALVELKDKGATLAAGSSSYRLETKFVLRLYGDPAQGWDKRMKSWAEAHSNRKVVEFYTDSRGARKTAWACQKYASLPQKHYFRKMSKS